MDMADPGTCYEYFFLIATFMLLHKNACGQKIFKFHAWVQKWHAVKISTTTYLTHLDNVVCERPLMYRSYVYRKSPNQLNT